MNAGHDSDPTEQYSALLEVSESIALHRHLPALFHDLAQRLHRVVRFDYLNLILYNPERNTMRLHVLETTQPVDVTSFEETDVDDGPAGWVWQNQKPYIIEDIAAESAYPRVMSMLRANGVCSGCMLPLTTAHRRVGALGFGSTRAHAYTEADLEFMRRVATQVAVAVDNTLNYERAQAYQGELARERDHLRVLVETGNALASHLDFRELFRSVSASVKRVIGHDYASLAVLEPGGQLRIHALEFPAGTPVDEETVIPADGTPAGESIASGRPVLLDHIDPEQYPSPLVRKLVEAGLRSVISVPLVHRERKLGAINVASFRAGPFKEDDAALLSEIGNQVAIALDNALAFREIAGLKDKLAKEKLYLEDEIRTEYNFEEIIGESAALKRVLHDVETVAPTDSTVLIQGESGTGKELVARAIHNLSARRERTFVKVNCAAIPTGLLESELFGHERGAFTGAIAQKIGRFELADGGTLFLDEIGDLPLELQPKLLRVLQEREFERLGGSRTIRVDVRLVTASNRDLAAMVAGRQFREDLYYRINVFPIVLPPLRDRREDISLLVRYFTQRFARRMNKEITSIPQKTMAALTAWDWPGNVRELENLIERAVILTVGTELQVPVAELGPGAAAKEPVGETLAAAEREHIVRILHETGWVIGGPHGAAARLGMKRTTLQSRIQKLGIRHD